MSGTNWTRWNAMHQIEWLSAHLLLNYYFYWMLWHSPLQPHTHTLIHTLTYDLAPHHRIGTGNFHRDTWIGYNKFGLGKSIYEYRIYLSSKACTAFYACFRRKFMFICLAQANLVSVLTSFDSQSSIVFRGIHAPLSSNDSNSGRVYISHLLETQRNHISLAHQLCHNLKWAIYSHALCMRASMAHFCIFMYASTGPIPLFSREFLMFVCVCISLSEVFLL